MYYNDFGLMTFDICFLNAFSACCVALGVNIKWSCGKYEINSLTKNTMTENSAIHVHPFPSNQFQLFNNTCCLDRTGLLHILLTKVDGYIDTCLMCERRNCPEPGGMED